MSEEPFEIGERLPDIGPLEVLDLLPHRYPMLMVDKLTEIEAHVRAVGVKCVTANEPHFLGHFPGNPVMPGIMMVEALGQAAGLLVIRSNRFVNVGVYFASFEKVKFRRPVTPGDVLRLEVERRSEKLGVYRFDGVVRVDGKVVCEATYSAKVMR